MGSNGVPITPFEACRIPVWYHSFAHHTFPVSFVKLHPEEIHALANGETKGEKASAVISRLSAPMQAFPGNCFVFVDTVAPTDTERFAGKRGAVYSPHSAWRFLAASEKVRKAAISGEVEYICVRPFRRMNKTREFRLFIYESKLKAMSQYWLIRHYRRLEGKKRFYWEQALKLVDEISWLLPYHTIVMDIYFTADNQILIIDFNPWGEKTSPLMLKTWEQDWTQEIGIKLIPPPVRVSGDVNVSF